MLNPRPKSVKWLKRWVPLLTIGLAGLALVGLLDTLIPAQAVDNCNLTALKNIVSSGGTLDFGCATDTTITLDASLTVATDLTLTNSGSGKLTISGAYFYRIFTVNPAIKFSLNNVSLVGGSNGILSIKNSTPPDGQSFNSIAAAGDTGGEAIYNKSGTVTVTNSTISNNTANNGFGAAIYNSGGAMTFSNSTFSNNTANNGFGGVISNSSGTMTVTNSTFSNNFGGEGGAIFNYNNGVMTISGSTFRTNTAIYGGAIYKYDGIVTVTNSAFSNNSAGSGNGGAINNNSGTFTVSNSTFLTNTATYGGAIIDYIGGKVIVTDSTFSGNTATFGGAMYNTNGTMTVTNSSLSNNSGGNGGAIVSNNGTVTVTNSTLSNNTASYGGAIFKNLGTLSVTNSTFSNNSAASFYGGAINNNDGPLTVANSTFSNNIADYGGAIINFTNTAIVTITNSTFATNSASNSGGAIYDNNSGTVTVSNSTFATNSATISGSAFYNDVGTLTLKSTLVSGANNCFGNITNAGYNLDTGNSCGFGSTNNSQSNVADPKIGLLANNGGPTQTIALLTGSPAIDAIPVASCTDLSNPVVAVTTDQRGITRPQGAACDIGAFEVIMPPTAPGTLTLSVVSSTRINLTWGDFNGETGYYVQRNTVGSNGPWSTVATVAANAITYSDTTVGPSTTYYYRVVAFNSIGSTSSNTANATTGTADFIVSVATDSGMAVDNNTPNTLSYALSHATTGKSIGFSVTLVTVNGVLHSVPAGVTIYGGKCGNPQVSIKAGVTYPVNPVTNGLVLSGGNVLVNIKVNGFPGIQLKAGPGGLNNVQCVSASKV